MMYPLSYYLKRNLWCRWFHRGYRAWEQTYCDATGQKWICGKCYQLVLCTMQDGTAKVVLGKPIQTP